MSEEALQEKTASVQKRASVGQVLSLSGRQTISVVVDNLVKHKQYGKYIRRRKKFAVHDPQGLAKVGDLVEIVPCRPISKTKSHRLTRVVRAAVAD